VRGLDDVLAALRAHGRECDEARLRSAEAFARAAHEGQSRLSGAPYLSHTHAVAYLLADLGFDETSAIVGLLHDTIEDGGVDQAGIAAAFGEEVGELVDGVTKIGRHAYVRRDEVQAESFRKLVLASARDVRVVLVKLADRLHNMMTLEHLPAEDRRRIAVETLEIYAPIAHRLGMAQVRGDLEDLAFFHLWPRQWAELEGEVQRRLKGGRRFLGRLVDSLEEALGHELIEATISYRVKRMWSIYQKLRRQGIGISQLYDYLAVRVVTANRAHAYQALGVVHERWRPVPGRFKDYVAMPKPNGYRSLHTTVIADHGQPLEVQIRTRDMDEIAERGIAAHWAYKQGRPGQSEPEVAWLRQVVEWQSEVVDPRTFLASLKIDLYPDEVYVFTPKGKVHAFPRGATPVDFAYWVHTEVGDHCVGAKVNGRPVALKTPLQNGDQVEILVDSARSPQREWLGFVVTARAKARVRQWLKQDARRWTVELGRQLLDREARRAGTTARRVLDAEPLAAFLAAGSFADADEALAALARGRIAPRDLLAAAGGAAQPGRFGGIVDRLRSSPDVVVLGHEGPVRRGSCCEPLPGDELLALVSRRGEVVVHRRDCETLVEAPDLLEREVGVAWSKEAGATWPVHLRIEWSGNGSGLARVTAALVEAKASVLGLETAHAGSGPQTVDVRLALGSRRELDELVGRLEALGAVTTVRRTPGGRESRRLSRGPA
jgi:GTP pyrophosphokinase